MTASFQTYQSGRPGGYGIAPNKLKAIDLVFIFLVILVFTHSLLSLYGLPDDANFLIDLVKFLFTSLVTALGAASAFLAFINNTNRDSQNLLSKEFLAISRRATDVYEAVAVNAIVSLEVFSVDNAPIYLKWFPGNSYPYLSQVTNLIASILLMQARNRERLFVENGKEKKILKEIESTFTEIAYVDVFSRMTRNLEGTKTQIDLSGKRLNNMCLKGLT
ncbi:MAG: hypothetical protein AAGI66_06300 [Cyanobacteria bacterium P01_H01_bin.74]